MCPFSVLHISDSHVSVEPGGTQNEAVLGDVFGTAEAGQADLVVCTGDFVQGPSAKTVEFVQQEVRRLTTQIDLGRLASIQPPTQPRAVTACGARGAVIHAVNAT